MLLAKLEKHGVMVSFYKRAPLCTSVLLYIMLVFAAMIAEHITPITGGVLLFSLLLGLFAGAKLVLMKVEAIDKEEMSKEEPPTGI